MKKRFALKAFPPFELARGGTRDFPPHPSAARFFFLPSIAQVDPGEKNPFLSCLARCPQSGILTLSKKEERCCYRAPHDFKNRDTIVR